MSEISKIAMLRLPQKKSKTVFCEEIGTKKTQPTKQNTHKQKNTQHFFAFFPMKQTKLAFSQKNFFCGLFGPLPIFCKD